MAPIEVVAGGVVQKCGYCGTSLRIGSGGEVTDILEFTSTEAEVRAAILARARNELPNLQIGRVLVPAMFVSAKAEGRWSADIGSQYKDGSWKWTPKSGGPIKRSYRNHCVLAAEGPWSVAFTDLASRALAAVPLRPEHLSGVTVLEVEGTERQRQAAAEEGIRKAHLAEVRKAVPKNARRFDATIDVQDLKLQRVLVPVWVFECMPQGERRRGFVDDATRTVHAMPGPVRRVGNGSVLAPLGLALAAICLLPVLFFGWLCCLGVGAEPPPAQKPAAVVEPAAPPVAASPPSDVRAAKDCDVFGFDTENKPVVIGRLSKGDALEIVARDERSVQLRLNGRPGWVPLGCIEEP